MATRISLTPSKLLVLNHFWWQLCRPLWCNTWKTTSARAIKGGGGRRAAGGVEGSRRETSLPQGCGLIINTSLPLTPPQHSFKSSRELSGSKRGPGTLTETYRNSTFRFFPPLEPTECKQMIERGNDWFTGVVSWNWGANVSWQDLEARVEGLRFGPRHLHPSRELCVSLCVRCACPIMSSVSTLTLSLLQKHSINNSCTLPAVVFDQREWDGDCWWQSWDSWRVWGDEQREWRVERVCVYVCE